MLGSQMEFLLPLIGATDLDDWPGGVRQQFKAACPMVEDILRNVPVRASRLICRICLSCLTPDPSRVSASALRSTGACGLGPTTDAMVGREERMNTKGPWLTRTVLVEVETRLCSQLRRSTNPTEATELCCGRLLRAGRDGGGRLPHGDPGRRGRHRAVGGRGRRDGACSLSSVRLKRVAACSPLRPLSSTPPPGGARVSGRASALLGVAGHRLALHRLLLCGSPTLAKALKWPTTTTIQSPCR